MFLWLKKLHFEFQELFTTVEMQRERRASYFHLKVCMKCCKSTFR